MPNLTLLTVQYHLNRDAVAYVMEDERGTLLRPGTQSALVALTPGGTGAWGDVEALAEAQRIVDAEFPLTGYTVVLPQPEESTPPE